MSAPVPVGAVLGSIARELAEARRRRFEPTDFEIIHDAVPLPPVYVRAGLPAGARARVFEPPPDHEFNKPS